MRVEVQGDGDRGMSESLPHHLGVDTFHQQLGRVAVLKDDSGQIYYKDGLFLSDKVENDLLRPIFENGKLLVDQTFAEVRAKLASQK